MELRNLTSDRLRAEIRNNRVSFPSIAPIFHRQSRSDIGWRAAVLFFVRSWPLHEIAKRYNLSRERTGQIVRDWRDLAVRDGYIQEIPAEPVTRQEGGTAE